MCSWIALIIRKYAYVNQKIRSQKMSIKTYARQDLILDNFLKLPESIPILTPSIKFCLEQLYWIQRYRIIDLNILSLISYQ